MVLLYKYIYFTLIHICTNPSVLVRKQATHGAIMFSLWSLCILQCQLKRYFWTASYWCWVFALIILLLKFIYYLTDHRDICRYMYFSTDVFMLFAFYTNHQWSSKTQKNRVKDPIRYTLGVEHVLKRTKFSPRPLNGFPPNSVSV